MKSAAEAPPANAAAAAAASPGTYDRKPYNGPLGAALAPPQRVVCRAAPR